RKGGQAFKRLCDSVIVSASVRHDQTPHQEGACPGWLVASQQGQTQVEGAAGPPAGGVYLGKQVETLTKPRGRGAVTAATERGQPKRELRAGDAPPVVCQAEQIEALLEHALRGCVLQLVDGRAAGGQERFGQLLVQAMCATHRQRCIVVRSRSLRLARPSGH